MIEIPLLNRAGARVGTALVSDEDAALAAHRWCLTASAGSGRPRYVHRNAGGGRYVKLHRVIMGLTPGDGLDVDHVNGDRLDNQRSNLRVTTRAQNKQNHHKQMGRSRFRGVYFDKARGKWKAQATLDGRNYMVGRFDSEEEAGAAASAWRAEHMPFSSDARDRLAASSLSG